MSGRVGRAGPDLADRDSSSHSTLERKKWLIEKSFHAFKAKTDNWSLSTFIIKTERYSCCPAAMLRKKIIVANVNDTFSSFLLNETSYYWTVKEENIGSIVYVLDSLMGSRPR